MKKQKNNIFIGGIQHETNGFSPIATSMAEFHQYQYASADEIMTRYRHTGTEIGGAIEEAERRQLSLVPSVFAAATPSGKILEETFEQLVSQLCHAATLAKASYSGMLLVLHGAMVAEHVDEADAYVLERLREVVGSEIPLAATFDLHANISQSLVDAADVLIGYNTFPHADMAERGAEALRVLDHMISTGIRPYAALRKLPLLPASTRQVTSEGVMEDIMMQLSSARTSAEIVSCSLAAGYPFADVPHLGMSVLVYGDYDRANEIADQIADEIWKRRAEFTSELVPVQTAVQHAGSAKTPVILVDSADNVGGGSPGDGTAILAELLATRSGKAVVVIWDPEAALKAQAAGKDGHFSALLGAHSHCGNGKPVQVDGNVEFVDQFQYTRTGSYMRGTVVDLGLVAVIQSDSIHIILTTHRLMPFDSDHLRALDIQPEEQDIIVVKSGSAWRAGFGELAGDVIEVDAPGITTQQFDRLPYTKKQRKLFPIDQDAQWP